jgi:hypothetical protein
MPRRTRKKSKKIGNSIRKSEMPEVGWVAESEMPFINRKFIQKIGNSFNEGAGWSSSQNNNESVAKTAQI